MSIESQLLRKQNFDKLCGVQKSRLVMPWATAWLDVPFQILVLSSGV